MYGTSRTFYCSIPAGALSFPLCKVQVAADALNGMASAKTKTITIKMIPFLEIFDDILFIIIPPRIKKYWIFIEFYECILSCDGYTIVTKC